MGATTKKKTEKNEEKFAEGALQALDTMLSN
jgi:hypothetical protein